jgi:hypothetical protein
MRAKLFAEEKSREKRYMWIEDTLRTLFTFHIRVVTVVGIQLAYLQST